MGTVGGPAWRVNHGGADVASTAARVTRLPARYWAIGFTRTSITDGLPWVSTA
jgi:hypothetical protein